MQAINCRKQFNNPWKRNNTKIQYSEQCMSWQRKLKTCIEKYLEAQK